MSHCASPPEAEGITNVEEGTEKAAGAAPVIARSDSGNGGQPQQEDRSSRKGIVASFACFLLYFLLLFVLMGLTNGWEYAQNYIVGFVLLFAGFLVLSHLSIDSRLSREGATTQGTVTNRKEEAYRCRRRNAHYIQYTYCVDGVEYENKEAWFQFHDPQLNGDVVDVKYLPGSPEISLPMTLTILCGNRSSVCVRQKDISPSAGSLKTPADQCCTWNVFVFSVPIIAFAVAANLVLNKSLHIQGELLVSFLAHLVAVSASGLLYYCWMRRCERKQRFSALSEPPGNGEVA